MQVELGLQPNCSEVVYRVPDMEAGELLEALKKIGITQVSVDNFYYWSDEAQETFKDEDNPNMPDYAHHSYMNVYDDEQGGSYISGHQHCQPQLFPTMCKISQEFGGEWHSEGGSILDYEEWLENEKPLKNFQREIEIFCGNADRKDLLLVVDHAKITYGIDLKIKRGGYNNSVLVLQAEDYDPAKITPCAVHPDNFLGGGRSIEDLMHVIRTDLRQRTSQVRS